MTVPQPVGDRVEVVKVIYPMQFNYTSLKVFGLSAARAEGLFYDMEGIRLELFREGYEDLIY